MEKQKKLNKLKVSIIIVLIVLSFTIAVFGRYIYNSAREAYFTARQFYFSSDILTVNGSEYQYEDWSGMDVYSIPIELYSYNNKFSKLDYNLDYTVTCSTSDSEKIKCTVNSYDTDATNTDTGTIPFSTNTSTVTIFVTPLTTLNENETVTIQVSASTQVPYQKTISCEFTLKVATLGGVSYTIDDEENRDYALLNLINTEDAATQVTLEFDPNKLRIDMNDDAYINRITDKDVNIDINGNEYVKKITFNISGETIKTVKFYKVDKAQNYTYPGVATSSEITVTT